mgnify:CR=1 FL=1|jgi:hypothetical protein
MVQAEIVIPAICLEKTPSHGVTVVTGDYGFDQTDAIADKMPASFQPASYNFCVSKSDTLGGDVELQSFSLTYASADKSKYYSLSRVGPDGGECFPEVELDDWNEYGHFDIANIAWNEVQVTSLIALFTGSGKSVDIGPPSSSD